jgi:hypothetical protein
MPEQPSSQAPGQEPDKITVEDFFAGATAERKPSADTVIDDTTGERFTPAPSLVAPERPPMEEAESLKEAAKLMDMRETVQALGLNYAADGEIGDWERYKYEPWAKRLLIEAWAPIVQQMNLRVNKWLQVFYAEGMGTAPLVMMTMKARKLRLENEELKRQLYQHQVNEAARAQAASAAPSNSISLGAPAPAGEWDRMNYDSKRKWAVDDNGYFLEG